jgi:hypothetical protein
VLKIQFGGCPSILQEDYITQNISVWGVNIWLGALQVGEKEEFDSAVFAGVEGELLCLKSNLEVARQSNGKIT